jgi:glycosyltransferase involved in cell wall biosynthesis
MTPRPPVAEEAADKLRSNIEVIIATLNEEKNLPHALGSVVDWADSVYVVDCGSDDATVAIAAGMGAQVVTHAWLGYAAQKQWALENLPLRSDWVFMLDADERVLPGLRDELLAISRQPVGHVPEAGYYVNRYLVFLGTRIRHCGYYPSWNLRFFKAGCGRYEDRAVHEHVIIDGPVGYLRECMEHLDRRGLEEYIAKHNRYSSLEALETFRLLSGLSSGELAPRLFGSPVERRRWIKRYIYPHLPAKGFCRFMFMYFIRLGFLDGRAGIRLCGLIAAYEMQIGLKLEELRRES